MTTSQVWQLSWVIITVLVVFLVASSTKRAVAIGFVIALVPFQTVETRYASSSVLIAYILTAILVMRGNFKLQMLPALGLIILAYLISFSQADELASSFHVYYMFQFFSCLLIFLLAYNFAREVESERSIVNVLLVMNLLVAGYCALQIVAGPGQEFVPFGIEGLAFNNNRDPGDPRLVGPFGTPGSTASYFMLMTLVLAVEAMLSEGKRLWLVQTVVVLNVFFLIATGNRGAFLVLVAMFPVLLVLFRRELGPIKVVQYGVGGFVALALAAAVAVSYTNFNVMFERLETVTETKEGVPSTRSTTWPEAIERIKKDPWLGEGPHFVDVETAEKLGVLRTSYDPFPHSLYLFLLRTVGIIGLCAVLWFFVAAWRVIFRASRIRFVGSYRATFLRVGLVLIPAFLIDQIRLEFNRPSTMDFAQFVFALIGAFVGLSDRHTREAIATDASSAIPKDADADQRPGCTANS